MTRLTRRAALALATLPFPALATTPRKSGARPGPFLIGADISWVPEDEAAGARYFVDGVRKDPVLLMRDAGFNAIRLRIFVDPAKGYSKREPDKAWAGLDQTIKLGRRIRQAGNIRACPPPGPVMTSPNSPRRSRRTPMTRLWRCARAARRSTWR